MKPLDSQTLYEILEVSPTASAHEIETAYRMASGAYAEGSLALYSVFDEDDAKVIRTRLDEAYRVLGNSEARASYDASLGADKPDLLGRASFTSRADYPSSRAESGPADPPQVETSLDAEEDGSGDFDGAKLRRARLRRGYEIDVIAQITKINPRYLRCIEDESYDALPAPVYVRGFVAAYARTIGLEPTPVAQSYMARMEEARAEKRPGWIRGRR